MAATKEDEKSKKLNALFESMGQQWQEAHQVLKEEKANYTRLLDHMSEVLSKVNSDSQITLRPYGSAVEGLKCLELKDIGDVDIMAFPTSDNLVIPEDFLEYSPDNPLHVRIKVGDHPVFKSCLADGTQYLATLAIKKFHPKIYGSLLPDLVDRLTRIFSAMPLGKLSVEHVNTCLKNKTSSPAVTINFSRKFGTIFNEYTTSDIQDNLSPKRSLRAADWDLMAHVMCMGKGVDYTRKHAEVVSDFVQFISDLVKAVQRSGLPLPAVFQELHLSNRAEELTTRFREIEGPSLGEKVGFIWQVPAEESKEEQFVSPQQSQDSVYGTSSAMLHNNYEGRRLSGEVSFTTSHSTSDKRQVIPVQETERKDLDSTGKNLREKRNEAKETQASEKEKTFEAESQSTEPLGRLYNDWLQHLLLQETDETTRNAPTETESSNGIRRTKSYHQASGSDFVPALRSCGWPKVAEDWFQQGRKWPSSDMVDRVLQEGVHLVVKPPKNNGNPDCDFRISFSHAEYLLSQEMNDIQRECYRCLKKIHRAYLSSPEGLESFHLKNLFLQTIEETGAEMWTEQRRAECMMKLLGKLLKALKDKDLRHFFVRSYNLFGVDYIQDPKILEPLAEMVKKIMENPEEFATEVIKNGEEELRKACSSLEKNHQQFDDDATEHPHKNNNHNESKEATYGASAEYRYHDLKDIYLKISEEMIKIAYNDTDSNLEALEPLERSIVERLKEIRQNYSNIDAKDVLNVFDFFWNLTYFKVWMSSEPDMRRRMLDAIHGDVELWKVTMKGKEDFPSSGDTAASLATMQDLSANHFLSYRNFLPAGTVIQCFPTYPGLAYALK
ncbi:Protein mab-21 [Stylophora pistillata]|uniref:Protein mab-21 n=1 Tax=Stylophora pistillata TaxID=50429 RepID=A0A2B4RUL3_STYPI|nr:Protein mab-21 [Stylophora pistillata]